MKITILGEPVAKGRPRFTNRGGYAKTYTPPKTAQYENLVRLSYQEQVGTEPMEGELTADIRAYFSIPKSTSKRRWLQMTTGAINPTKRPDCDNIAKAILDALNGIAYKDDAQIIELHVEKHYSDQPRAIVDIEKREPKA